MKKIRFVIALSLTFILLTSCSCVPNKKYYFSYSGIWFSDSPFIVLDCKHHQGVFTISNMTYDIGTAHANNGVNIILYNSAIIQPEGGLSDEAYLWVADTKVKNNKLYLTVTEDRISDYEGKTIVLDFYTYEEWEALQNAG